MAQRVVFDCNTLLQALASPSGPAGRCVQMALDEKIQLFISPVVLNELNEVAGRASVVAKLRIAAGVLEEYMRALEMVAILIIDVPDIFQYPRDPDDAHYVNLAVAADAELVVSRDRDLLDLMNEDQPEARDFKKRFPGLRIVDPVRFLQELHL